MRKVNEEPRKYHAGGRREEGFTLSRGAAQQGFTPSRGAARQGFTPSRGAAQQGFTLVELMVVIVIIGILATIVVINVLPSGDRARTTKARTDIVTITGALDLYKLQNGAFPTTEQGLQALVTAPAGADASRYQRGGYIRSLPQDPWSHPYLYASPGQHGEADVWTLGADNREGGEGVDADIGSWQQ